MALETAALVTLQGCWFLCVSMRQTELHPDAGLMSNAEQCYIEYYMYLTSLFSSEQPVNEETLIQVKNHLVKEELACVCHSAMHILVLFLYY